jgi:hypothetical protein
MRISFVLAFSLILVFVLFTSCNTVYALEENVGKAMLYPSNPFYSLKTIREGIEMQFAGTKRTRLLRQLEFATRRLREAKALEGSSNEDLIQRTMEYYWKSLNTVLSSQPMDDTLVILLNHVIAIHFKEFENLYSDLSSEKAKRAIRALITKMGRYEHIPTDVKVKICNFLLRESTSSTLNKSEQAIYRLRAQECLVII